MDTATPDADLASRPSPAHTSPRRGESVPQAAIDQDQAARFVLRRPGDNSYIEAAMPLFGLVLRARDLGTPPEMDALYRQVMGELTSLTAELTENGVPKRELMAYRYILCAFIDEAILGTEWGSFSIWAQHSMLSRFHSETWGGEKVFAILGKLEQEPQRYRRLLEFIYLCLCLGFKGKYQVAQGGQETLDRIRLALHETLYGRQESRGEPLTRPLEGVIRKREGAFRIPPWVLVALTGLALTGIYSLYRAALDERIRAVLVALEQLTR